MADELESVGSRRNHEKTARWAESVAQQSLSIRPLSLNVGLDPPTSVTHDRVDKRFTTYPKTTPLFQPAKGVFSKQLPEPSILKEQNIRKSIRLMGSPLPLTRTTFQQQETSAVQNRNRSQSTISNSLNRSVESKNTSTLNQTTPQVIYQPVSSSDTSGLPKLNLTEFSGDLLECWSGLSGRAFFEVVVHQKPVSKNEKGALPEHKPNGQAKAAISGMGFSSQSHYHAWDILCEKYGRSAVRVNTQIKKIHTRPPIRHDDSTSVVKFANVVTNAGTP